MMYLPEAPPRGAYAVPYSVTTYETRPRRYFLGEDTPSTMTISSSAMIKWIFVGVATTIIAEMLRRSLYGK